MQLCSSKTGLGSWQGCRKVCRAPCKVKLVLGHHAKEPMPFVTKTQGRLHHDADLVAKSTQTPL